MFVEVLSALAGCSPRPLPPQGAGVKIGSPQNNVTGGLVRNVTWENIVITRPRNTPLYIDVFNEDAPSCGLPPDPARPDWLTVQNVTFRNISALVLDAAQGAGCFLCAPTVPCSGFAFDNVSVVTSKGNAAAPYQCFNFEGAAAADSSPLPCGLGFA